MKEKRINQNQSAEFVASTWTNQVRAPSEPLQTDTSSSSSLSTSSSPRRFEEHSVCRTQVHRPMRLNHLQYDRRPALPQIPPSIYRPAYGTYVEMPYMQYACVKNAKPTKILPTIEKPSNSMLKHSVESILQKNTKYPPIEFNSYQREYRELSPYYSQCYVDTLGRSFSEWN